MGLLILFHESLLNPVSWISVDSLCVISLNICTFLLRRCPKISTCSAPRPFSLPCAVGLQLLPFGVVLFPFSCPVSRVLFSSLNPHPYHPAPPNYISITDHSFSINRSFTFTFTRTFFETTPLKVGL